MCVLQLIHYYSHIMIMSVVVNFEIAAICKALKCIRENSVMEIPNFNKIKTNS